MESRVRRERWKRAVKKDPEYGVRVKMMKLVTGKIAIVVGIFRMRSAALELIKNYRRRLLV